MGEMALSDWTISGKGSSSSSCMGGSGARRGSRNGLGFAGVLNGFARDTDERREGMGCTLGSGEEARCLLFLLLAGEKGLDVTADGSTLTGRGLDLVVDWRTDDVEGRG